MDDDKKTVLKRRSLLMLSRTLWIAVGTLASAGLLLSVGQFAGNHLAAGKDAEMREHLLQQTMEIANVINPELVKKLTFTLADENTTAFKRIREQMLHPTVAIQKLRSIYSMAIQGDKIVFGPDNLASDDDDHAPPGDAYQSPPAELYQSLQHNQKIIVGPYSDEWGTFVSAFVPILDPHSSKILMVIGIDIDAADWQIQLNAVRRAPLLVVFAVILILTCGFIAVRWRNQRMKSDALRLKAWIIAPTTVAILTGLMFYGIYQYKQFSKERHQNILRLTQQIKREWNQNINSEVQLLKAQMDNIAINPAILKALQSSDLSSLTALAQPIFEQMKYEYKITHFVFTMPDKTVFLRVQSPDRRGKILNRPTLLIAEQTSHDSWGLDMGTAGDMSLRYVRPWKQNDKIIGYIELGIDIESLAMQMAANVNIDIATIIWKKHTTRDDFETGKKVYGLPGQWDDYPDFVVAHQTSQQLPEDVARQLKYDSKAGLEYRLFNAQQDKKRFACGVIHLLDTAGNNSADIVVIQDTTIGTRAAHSILFMSLILAIVLLGSVLILLWLITGTVEIQLANIFETLRRSETKFRMLYDTTSDAIMMLADGKFFDCNKSTLEIYGCASIEEFCSKHPADFSPLKQPCGEDSLALANKQIAIAMEKGSNRFEWVHKRADNGKEFLADVLINMMELDGKKVVHTVVRDITERKLAEEKINNSQKLLKKIINLLPIRIFWKDKNLRFLGCNDIFAKDAGKNTAEDLIGKDDFQMNWKEHAESYRNDDQSVMTSGKSKLNYEELQTTPNGDRIWLKTSKIPLIDFQENIIGVLGTYEDITEHKQAEESMKDLNLELEQAVRKLEETNQELKNFGNHSQP